MQNNICLRSTVSSLIVDLLPVSTFHKSFFINNIPQDFYVSTNSTLLTEALYNVLDNIVRSAENKCIRVEAVVEEENITLLIQDAGNCYYGLLSPKLPFIMPVFRKLGMYFSVRNKPALGTVVGLSIPGIQLAA